MKPCLRRVLEPNSASKNKIHYPTLVLIILFFIILIGFAVGPPFILPFLGWKMAGLSGLMFGVLLYFALGVGIYQPFKKQLTFEGRWKEILGPVGGWVLIPILGSLLIMAFCLTRRNHN